MHIRIHVCVVEIESRSSLHLYMVYCLKPICLRIVQPFFPELPVPTCVCVHSTGTNTPDQSMNITKRSSTCTHVDLLLDLNDDYKIFRVLHF